MKKPAKQTLRIGIGVLLVIIGIGAGIMVYVYLDHRKQIEQECETFPPPGVMVETGAEGEKQHVYSEGEGSPTLVFLSGLGTPFPVYDFSALTSRLSSDYRTVVVERPGYGWSEISSEDRGLSVMLEETRTALKLAGEQPPFVLFAHSMGGLEALYWGTQYRDEILAVVGLDAGIPQFYLDHDVLPVFSPVVTFLARSGLIRFNPDICQNLPAVAEGHIPEEEIESVCALFYRRTQTENMLAEEDALLENSRIAASLGTPKVPLYYFISREGGQEWITAAKAMVEEAGGSWMILEAGHYIHTFKPDEIAEKSTSFIQKVLDGKAEDGS